MLFKSLLKFAIQTGALKVIDHKGTVVSYGDGSSPKCTIRLKNPRLDYTIPFNPGLNVPEAYMNGELVVEDGTLYDFVELAAINYSNVESFPLLNLLQWIGVGSKKLKQYNPIGIAEKNVAHHYDLSDQLYDLFLDVDRQYSCAYFSEPQEDLDTAQQNKKRHLAAKMLLDRADANTVLDIGSGWGGLGIYIAEVSNANITGVTLSKEQHQVSNERAARAGLKQRVKFELLDYRKIPEKFDRIVSVGMFEHVGKKNFAEFFNKLCDLMTDDGVAVIHSIGRLDTPAPINPFIRKYIFPGADIPALSEITPTIEKSGLICTDIEILRLHYAETLRHWRERFNAGRDKIRKIYDERFCRMWDLYLVICELGFRYENLMVFQLQVAKSLNAVPLTRDYMFEWERKQLAKERNDKEEKAA
ncbi:MAG: cyclopropane-fatty-acyl-phospholipid synthase family protein [Pseudomonadota bacterium]|nr:cyclopropane-fatty-acyl-phospholipid synthase family protein [Pseudomonadota bacterium]